MWIRSGTARVIVVAVASAVAVGCGDGEPSDGSVVLGSVYNLTGSQAVLDVPSSHGSMLAVSEINAKGGVLGRRVSVVELDGESSAETLPAKTEELLVQHPDIAAFFGLSDTDMVLAAAPVAAAHQRVFLSSGATSPRLPREVPEFLFLACFGDNVQAAAGAEWAYGDLGARKALVLYDPTESYTDLLKGYFVERFEELGGTIVATASIGPPAESIVLPPAGDVDLVFLSVETAQDAARVIPVLRDAGYSGPLLGGDGYDAESTWGNHPDISDVYFTTHVYLGADSPNPQVTAFLQAYAQAYPGQEPSAFAALGYDAVNLLAGAMETAGNTTPAAVAAGLSGLGAYSGITGTISFEGNDRIPKKSVTLIEVRNGKQTFVTELIPESVPDATVDRRPGR